MTKLYLHASLAFTLGLTGALSGCADPVGSRAPPGVNAEEVARRTSVTLRPGEFRGTPRIMLAPRPSHPEGELGDIRLRHVPGNQELPLPDRIERSTY